MILLVFVMVVQIELVSGCAMALASVVSYLITMTASSESSVTTKSSLSSDCPSSYSIPTSSLSFSFPVPPRQDDEQWKRVGWWLVLLDRNVGASLWELQEDSASFLDLFLVPLTFAGRRIRFTG